MNEGAVTISPTWSQMLWSGRGKPATRWRTLIGGVLALALAWVSYALMLSTIRWTMPLKLAGWTLLLATLALLFVGARALLRVLLHMGIKRLLIRLGILYVLAIVLVAWLVPSGQTGIGHVMSSAGSILTWVADGFGSLGTTAIEAPAAVSFAATGKRTPVRVPGVEWVGDVPPTPIVVLVDEIGNAAPAAPSATAPASVAVPGEVLQVGDIVRVVNTGGQGLRVRDIPSREGAILIKFAEGSSVQIIEGPKQADGRTWWKVKGASGEGWCAADFLARKL
ncbi:MAG: SH3 domain-containing protein [Kouleothrix sp.]|nr:SH3 domain-containing protein [Kouleothrix sp.]